MKEFNLKRFCDDLTRLRGEQTQQKFAEKLGINRSTLSLLETGKQIPSLEILNKICNLGKFQPNDYFQEISDDSLIFLMGKLEKEDRVKVDKMMRRIRIKEKYDMLARRSENAIN